MHRILKTTKIRRRGSFLETALLVLIAVFGFLLAGSLHDRSIQQKWGTAIMGTLVTFGFVIYAFRRHLLRWSFWASFIICLAVHVLAIGAIFYYVLSSLERFSTLFWLPIMLLETFVLLIAVKRIEEKITGQHETMKLTF